MNLFPFQESALQEIRDKFLHHLDRLRPEEGRNYPFIQFLRAITGAGKTPILAGVVSEMALAVAPTPIILWTSKTSAVVSQTLENLDTGGKYHSLVQTFIVKDITEVRIADIYDVNTKLIITSTVASFNRTSKEGLKVFNPRSDQESGTSLWDALIYRRSKPLFIIYDEGHNTTDNQVDLLLELRPEAILLASATPKITPRLRDFIQGDPSVSESARKRVTTTVETRHVVENELIKSVIKVTDYDNPEEFIIQDMVRQYQDIESLTLRSDLAIQPKCIYVSTTNETGDHKHPFHQRKARPIFIWRVLVEKAGIDANTVGVYCSLKGNDFPENFHLIKKFEDLQRGNFKHIIFNLGLQEGWDDPEVYFAYIDKTLRSPREITQIIGRVLRQPHAKKTSYEVLNSAHFCVSCPTDKFRAVIEGIRAEIGAHYNDPDNDFIRVIEQSKTLLDPLPVKETVPLSSLPKLATRVDPEFVNELKQRLEEFPDYRKIPELGHKIGEKQTRIVEVKTGQSQDLGKQTQGIGQRIVVGELFRRELLRTAKDAAEALDIKVMDNEKFNIDVCYASRAATEVRDLVKSIADLYLDYVTIEPGMEEYSISPFQLSSSSFVPFVHALHSGYDGLNYDEVEAANALDTLGYPWFRNLPDSTGYKIPLASTHTKGFFPDFIVFGKKTIWCVEPKGEHLLTDAIRDKLISSIKLDDGRALRIVIVVRGTWENRGNEIVPRDKKGITVITRRGTRGTLIANWYEDYQDCFKKILKEVEAASL